MKILDRYLLKSFAITFASVFVILFFIFILQTVWLFIAELAGKDLDLLMVLKFLLFAMPRMVPLVLPLSVLLASIMTFGNMAENYEFAAMKASGISLQRAMKGLTIFIVILSFFAFFFANNVIPFAEYKFINFRKDIAQMKPAMAIAEGQFSDVGTYNIKVNKKSGENGNILTGITIHKKSSQFDGSRNVIKAKNGELVSNEKTNILRLELNDGFYYEDMNPKKFEEKQRLPFAKSSFRKYIINLDLSKLNTAEGPEYEIANTNTMLNVNELRYTIDSLDRNFGKDVKSFGDNIYQRTGINFVKSVRPVNAPEAKPFPTGKEVLSSFNNAERSEILKMAAGSFSSAKYAVEGAKFELDAKTKNINTHWIALYDKFVIAYACLLMFFIGAPLGAIIRKGGLGLPIVFAILIFIIFHFTNTFGKKLAQEDGIPAFLGCWLSSFILTPFAVLLTYRATNDQSISIDFDWLTDPVKKMFGRKKSATPLTDAARIINLAAIRIQKDGDWDELQAQSDQVLVGTVYNARKFNVRESKRVQALKVLEERGISQSDLLQQGKLYNAEYERLQEALESHDLDAKLTFALYLVTVVLALVAQNNPKMMAVIIPAFVLLVGFYISLYKTEQRRNEIEGLLQKPIGPNLWVAMLLGLPCYFVLHFTNKQALKRALQESNV